MKDFNMRAYIDIVNEANGVDEGLLGTALRKLGKTSKLDKSNRINFDPIPLPQKVTGKVHGDPSMGNTAKWKKDSNLHMILFRLTRRNHVLRNKLQQMISDVRQGKK